MAPKQTAQTAQTKPTKKKKASKKAGTPRRRRKKTRKTAKSSGGLVKMGRPSIYQDVWTPGMREAVLDEFRQGASITEVAVLVLQISVETFYTWLDARGKESFTACIREGYAIARAWWLRQGRLNLVNPQFNVRLWEANMRNRYNWTGTTPTEQLPMSGRGQEDEAAAGLRNQVDIGAIIDQAEQYRQDTAIDVEYTEVAPEAPTKAKPSGGKAKEAAGPRKSRGNNGQRPPLPKALRQQQAGGHG